MLTAVKENKTKKTPKNLLLGTIRVKKKSKNIYRLNFYTSLYRFL